ncbi:MAG TPA: hypothetical protein VF485_03070 [Sphingomonas sp.]
MQSAIESFAPSANGPLPGVSGAPVALICQSWDQFADIYNALNGNVSEIGLATEEHALVALSSEYSALSYVAGTAANLQNSPAIIPAYAPLLTRIGNQADAACNTISQLAIPDIRTYASTGTGDYIIAASLKPQVDRIANGYGEVQISYALDRAFNSVSNTSTRLGLPGGGEQNLGGFVHYRAEGSDQGDQILTLLHTFDRDANGIPFIAARMHYQDPYAPPATQQQDLFSVRQLLNQTGTLSCTAAWPDYPANEITVTLIAPTG